MAGIAIRIPIVATCTECGGELEAAYDLPMDGIVASKGKNLLSDMRSISSDLAAFLSEGGWVVYGQNCICPDCAEVLGVTAPMPADALGLLREARNLIRGGRPPALDRHRADAEGDASDRIGYGDEGAAEGAVYGDGVLGDGEQGGRTR